ncbi:hypothetical protein [Ethanoligenens harbinense]|uniref:Uncharacterized protein n=1 Tax=Ethanoligenens harbinense (strain DSM 18485 / JCM 12961 / CGMCC 1.5033 / YUAN-3) TaxID=663278 RepID=E6U5U5_ETHHY|nr:hypothetical protein [Ethanoligenens harbinense]ADU27962.1 hypothetical protein Ethha_2468 [Ethanoligenens harbinense YUAN-3]AVQ96990.1 N-acetyltransferase [Ethanoligenens harbinense YUAN-3]AYF39650.1 N-acetyltransferase [Ethanoligenens harbinense]AYF42482.1 N-acetyltransferase [Ethanoligenens harbinense]QCN93232.1 N-acetyltransferase [Ethanoligenens harbinense]
MSNNLQLVTFGSLNIHDPFFDSLKNDYKEFERWFTTTASKRQAYVQFNDDGTLNGLLAMKMEHGVVNDVVPPIKSKNILKISTFKINPHGTRLGERFIKKALDYAIQENASICYVSMFVKQDTLIRLLEKYGFTNHGNKTTNNGTELILVKRLSVIVGDIYKDFPLMKIAGNSKYLLSIYPKYHSIMFPDSILKNETIDILDDVSHTNSIHKIYVCRMRDVSRLSSGDLVVIYRTADDGRSAEYSSVATSICIIDEVKHQSQFRGFDDFFKYASKYSVFDRDDLFYWYGKQGCYTIKMTYNAALSRRLTRHKLIEEVGVDREQPYWGFVQITDDQFKQILKDGGVNESLIIDQARIR